MTHYMKKKSEIETCQVNLDISVNEAEVSEVKKSLGISFKR